MYLIISVGSKDIMAQEWKPDFEDDVCKYCEPFNTWADLLKVLGEHMNSYLYIKIVDDTLSC